MKVSCIEGDKDDAQPLFVDYPEEPAEKRRRGEEALSCVIICLLLDSSTPQLLNSSIISSGLCHVVCVQDRRPHMF